GDRRAPRPDLSRPNVVGPPVAPRCDCLPKQPPQLLDSRGPHVRRVRFEIPLDEVADRDRFDVEDLAPTDLPELVECSAEGNIRVRLRLEAANLRTERL